MRSIKLRLFCQHLLVVFKDVNKWEDFSCSRSRRLSYHKRGSTPQSDLERAQTPYQIPRKQQSDPVICMELHSQRNSQSHLEKVPRLHSHNGATTQQSVMQFCGSVEQKGAQKHSRILGGIGSFYLFVFLCVFLVFAKTPRQIVLGQLAITMPKTLDPYLTPYRKCK